MFTNGGAKHTMKQIDYVLQNKKEVLGFLKSRFPMFHLSNFFFRDIQYGIRAFMTERGMKVSYADAEVLARAFAESLEKDKIFRPVDSQSWTVIYPEYRTPEAKKNAAAKPVPQQPAQTPAAG